MPIFTPRSRIEIIREMVARVVARSRLVGVTRNSVVFHILAAAAEQDAEQYFQMARIRDLFSIDKATGSDLDERAAEIQPAFVTRRLALFASGNVQFSRPGTTGTIAIPSGTIVAAQDSDGQIKFRTTSAGSILAGSTTSGLIPVVAVEAGTRGNVAAAQIIQMVTRIAGVTGVTNPSAFSTGQDRESDANFRARLKAFVQSLSRATPNALEGFARGVILLDGRRVVFAHVVEPIIPNGKVELYIDDGAGTTEEFDSSLIGFPETILTAVGGERDVFTTNKPIRDDGSFVLRRNTVVQTRNTQYYLNAATGQATFDTTLFPTGLTAGDVITAEYRFYTGLIQETQKVMDGDPLNPITKPGVRAAGIQVFVLPATAIPQTVVAQISVLDGFDPAVVSANVKTAIQEYINTLDIDGDVIVSAIIERAMSVNGMFNFKMTSLTGSAPPADQIILGNQAARITAANITLT